MSVFVGIRDGSGLIFQNWNKCIFTCQPAVKSILGSLSWFHLSMGCQTSFLCQYTAKLSYLCKSCKGAKIALNPPLTILLILLKEILSINTVLLQQIRFRRNFSYNSPVLSPNIPRNFLRVHSYESILRSRVRLHGSFVRICMTPKTF